VGRTGDRAAAIGPTRGGGCRDCLLGIAASFLHHRADARSRRRLAHDIKLDTTTPQENIAELSLIQPTYFTVSRTLLYIRQYRRVSFYAQASLASSVAISITASTGELCCEEPRFGSHSIRPLLQRSGACLAGSQRIPLGMNAFPPTYGRPSVILTPVESAPLAYFVVIVRLFRYGSVLRCSLEASQP
jgi:hypothetical protein